jgi:hypothetical protein
MPVGMYAFKTPPTCRDTYLGLAFSKELTP